MSGTRGVKFKNKSQKSLGNKKCVSGGWSVLGKAGSFAVKNFFFICEIFFNPRDKEKRVVQNFAKNSPSMQKFAHKKSYFRDNFMLFVFCI